MSELQVNKSLAVTVNIGALDGVKDGSWTTLAEYPLSEAVHDSLTISDKLLPKFKLTTISADIRQPTGAPVTSEILSLLLVPGSLLIRNVL